MLRSEQFNIQENFKLKSNGVEEIKKFRKLLDDFELEQLKTEQNNFSQIFNSMNRFDQQCLY